MEKETDKQVQKKTNLYPIKREEKIEMKKESLSGLDVDSKGALCLVAGGNKLRLIDLLDRKEKGGKVVEEKEEGSKRDLIR